MDKRKHIGRKKQGVIIPVAPSLSEMDERYFKFIEDIKNEIKKRRISAIVSANSNMICMYWNIGRAVLEKQSQLGWGAKVIDRISKDLKEAFPEMNGFSPRNINICVNLQIVGEIMKLCNVSLHNCHGEQIYHCWINFLMKKVGYGMLTKPSKMVGVRMF